MSAKFTLEGSGQGAVKVIQQANAELDKTDKAAQRAVASSKKLEEQLQKQAQRIKESIDPQQRLNRHYAELGQHVQAGRLTMDEATAAGVKYRKELLGAADAGNKAFGPSALAQVGQMLAGYLSMGAAISAATSALRENSAERERAAQKAMASRAGLGQLSQLAAGDSDPRASFAAMVAEARGYVASGAAIDENEAGALLFQLAGAGLGAKDRAFAANLRRAGTLANVGGAAEAYSALKTALGAEETGGFQEFMSKALRAAGPAPGSFEQLPIAAARAGASAKALGVSDEFLLAATTVLGKTTGSIDEGGTLLAAFLRGIEKSGDRGFQGVGGLGIVERLASMPVAKQGFGGILGDRAEAVTAFRTLRENMPELRSLIGDVTSAQRGNLAGFAAGLPETDPDIAYAIGRAAAEGERDVAQRGALSQRQNLIQALRADRRAAMAERGEQATGRGIIEGIEDLFGLEGEISRSAYQLQQRRAAGQSSPFSESTTRLLEDYLRRTAESTERVERNQRSRATTRQE